MILPLSIPRKNCLIYSELQHYPGRVHVGTYLAIIHIERDESMTNLHSPASNKTILVVDDYPDNLDIAKTILEGNGYGVQTAGNGPEAFSRWEEQKPDLIILDIMMPRMDGLEILERLKGTAETSSIPVILLTAKVQYDDVLEGYKLGADYYITKPFTSTQLINGINLILNGDQEHSNQPDQFIKAWLAVIAKWLDQPSTIP